MEQLTLFPVKATGKKVPKRTPATVNLNKVNKKLARKRYYLHKQLPKEYILDGAARKIDVPYQRLEDIPIGPRYYVLQLIKLGYQVQLKVFSEHELKTMINNKPPLDFSKW